jgi:hypothetical protein
LISPSYASFCSPKGKWNKEIAKIVSSSYQMARGEDLWYFYSNQKTKINRLKPQVVLKNTKINAVKWWIEQAKDQQKPLILVFHEIAKGGNHYYYPPNKFAELINLIKDYKIITFHQLYSETITQLTPNSSKNNLHQTK